MAAISGHAARDEIAGKPLCGARGSASPGYLALIGEPSCRRSNRHLVIGHDAFNLIKQPSIGRAISIECSRLRPTPSPARYCQPNLATLRRIKDARPGYSTSLEPGLRQALGHPTSGQLLFKDHCRAV